MRVNIDDKIINDERITFAAAQLNITRPELIGRLISVWMSAYQRRSAVMARRSVDALAGLPRFADVMVAEDLATPIDDDLVLVRLRGVTERIEWLELQDSKREKALAAKRAKAGLPAERPPGPAAGSPPGRPYSPTLTPTHDPDQAHAHEGVAAAAARALPSEAVRLADLLLTQIASANPDTTIAKLSAEARDRRINTWAKDIEALHRKGIAYPDIATVIEFATADKFWAPIILSGKKLLEKYDTLVGQRGRKGNGTKAPAMPSADDYEAVPAHMRGAS